MSAEPLPKVGQTRCYWALLSADLEFIYLDPILQLHLEEQAPLLLAKSLLSFVHPEEQTSAKLDLGGVLDSRTLHGSVTRVRFSRLSRVRRLLGYKGPPAQWADAEKIALDSDYMAVDIVINWAADGLVLCFIHAIVDLSPTDNDELHRTGWSNWCGTPRMDNDQIQGCYNYLMASVHTPPSINRVFQILDNSDGRALLLSWPPDPNQGTQHPNARDFAQLVENAQIGPSPSSSTSHNVNEAKTSCTRRYKALQTMSSVPGSQVESIFIPHGSVIFACHKLNSSPSRSTASSSATMQQLGYVSPSPYTSASSYYDAPQSSYALPPLSSSSAYTSYLCAPQRWSGSSDYPPPQQSQQQQWGSGSPSPSLPPAVSNLRAGSYPPPPAQFSSSSAPGAPQGSPFLDLPRPLSPYPNPSAGSYSPGAASNDGSHGSLGDEMLVPPARRRASPVARGDNYIPGGRNAGNRPNGVLKCSSCKTTTSPEWRKGPSGKKELCNACGLRYARSRAKKEGHPQTQRRRKEKGAPTVAGGGITKREASATPPYHLPIPGTSASAPVASTMPTLRGVGPGVGSLSASVGTSGDMYHHPHHQALDDAKAGLRLTPSPSPPGFVHYAPGGGSTGHHGHGHAPGHQFYGVPSPLSHTIPLEDEQSNGNGSGHGGSGNGLNGNPTTANQQLPPMAAYVGRSPLSTMPPPSFERDRGERERERDRERELPPPISLQGHRRILAQQG